MSAPRLAAVAISLALTGWQPALASDAWPGNDWQVGTPESVGMDSQLLAQALAQIAGDVMVVRDGYLVGMKGDISRPTLSYSLSKSITALVYGTLLQSGQVALDDLVPNSDYPTAPLASWRDFLRMTSDYGLTPHQPGSYYAYNNMAVHRYGSEMQPYFGGQDPVAVVQQALFQITGRQDQLLHQGLWSGWGGGFTVSPRDAARLGLMVLRDGRWMQQQVVPTWFTGDLYPDQIPPGAQANTSTGGSPTQGPPGNNWWNQDHITVLLPGNYSYGFWTNASTRYPELPAQTIWGEGLGGHYLLVAKKANLVVAAFGTGEGTPASQILRPILDAIIDQSVTGGDDEVLGTVGGELKTWHRVTVTFPGPETHENDAVNPFLDRRLDVVFSKGGREFVVPGYYCADGDAAETGAAAGNRWRVHFRPDEPGTWSYEASFRSGPAVAVSPNPETYPASHFDGARGTFRIRPSDKSGADFRGRGMLKYVGARYPVFAATGEPFLKGGADSPENFLGYAGFDQTPPSHQYAPHALDWQPGDADWGGGRGRNIAGALRYLAGAGMNSVYFLTMNVQGDGNDVWPWTSAGERYRYDCSKLDQWEIVFEQMDRLGIQMHVVTQEHENDKLLDGGQLGPMRRLYYRELVARFAHHPALQWNLGEENTNGNTARKQFADHLMLLDPFDHPVVVHTRPDDLDLVYTLLLGHPSIHGASLQVKDMDQTHTVTRKWVEESAQAGQPWIVCVDEIGPPGDGVLPDASDPTHDEVRRKALWGNLMAGGAGAEWYFGYDYPHNDLDCEDWRSRDVMWRQTGHALDLFREHLPFTGMQVADELVTASQGRGFAKPGEVYLVYLERGGSTWLHLQQFAETFTVEWFDPRTGQFVAPPLAPLVQGPGLVYLPPPPHSTDQDWAIVVRRVEDGAFHYGQGVPGQGGVIPVQVAGIPQLGNADMAVLLGEALPHAGAMVLIGNAPAAVPLLGGTRLNNGAYGFLSRPTDGAGHARLALPVPDSPALAGQRIYFQWLVPDPAAPQGAAMTSGLEITILP